MYALIIVTVYHPVPDSLNVVCLGLYATVDNNSGTFHQN